MQGYRAISRHLEQWKGSLGGFLRDLDRHGARYISFSHVGAVEFCEYRYYLERVKRMRLRPEPDYFVKGSAFHAAVARYYSARARNRTVDVDALHAAVDAWGLDEGHHVKNAITLAVGNAHDGWEIVGVEQPFVLYLGSRLPPCIGVIDLILRKGSKFAVIDHKTGRTFNEPDELQLVLYREYVRRHYRARTCRTFYDE